MKQQSTEGQNLATGYQLPTYVHSLEDRGVIIQPV